MSKNIADIYPLSPMQQGMLFYTLREPEEKPYFQQESYNIQGEFDLAAFEQSWQKLIDNHPILRTAFNWERREKPLQIVYHRVELPWRYEDWRGLSNAEQQERLRAFTVEDRERGFDLAAVPLTRITLFRLGDSEYQFTWSFHHLLIDGWSKSLLFREALMLYKSMTGSPAPKLERSRPFHDYISWLKTQDMNRAETFWRETLRGFSAPTPLGLDRRRPDAPEGYDKQTLNVGPAPLAALQAFTRQHGLTLNTLVQGIWALMLSRYGGEERVLYGVTVSGRPADLAGADEMVGMLINTIPAVFHVEPKAQLVAWLKGIQIKQAEARQFEYTPLVQAQAWSEVPRGQPLFESLLIFENFPRELYTREGGGELKFNLRRFNHPVWSHLPLTLIVSAGSELEAEVIYDLRRFDAATVSRMLGHFEHLLESVAENQNRRLEDLPVLTEAERSRMLSEWNDTRAEFAHDRPLHELFEAQAQRTPDSAALTYEGRQLTYAELDARANRLANHLRGLGVGPEVRVGLCVGRSIEMVVALLAVLKAGGAYVPLDPEYPSERIAYMLEDSGVSVLLTQSSLLDTLPRHAAHVVSLDADWPLVERESDESPRVGVSPDNAAYVIYTSGSTGRPKGVVVTHASVARLFTATDSWTRFGPEDVWTLFHSYAFDFSVWEIWGALLYGGRLVVVPYWVSRAPESFYELLREERVTVLNQTPSAFRQLMRAEESSGSAAEDLSLRLVVFGGEALELQSLRPWFERHGDERPRLVNMYGITETTVHVTQRPLVRADAEGASGSVVGRPIADQQVYVLDSRGRLAPAGAAGEMYVGGAGSARGYLNRPELTAERFVPNPFAQRPGERLYRTGDLARHLPGGEIEYLGRVDQQVKIRGFRIELGEVEASLAAHEGVRQAVVAARDGDGGEKRLVAYVVGREGHRLNSTELRAFLKERLPEYMVPSAFTLLDELPLTPSGKVDRRALPSLDQTRPELEKPLVAPRTPVEQELAAIWCELLGIEEVGIEDNFFELGGHSLLITQLASRVRQRFDVDLSLRQLFNMPTIVEMTKAIAVKQVESEDPEEAAQMLEELKRLSPDEIKALLEAEEGALAGPES